MSKINKELDFASNIPSKKEEFLLMEKQRKENAKKLKQLKKQRNKLLKADIPIQKKYIKELKQSKKEYKKNRPNKLSEVKKWYNSLENKESNKKQYKQRMSNIKYGDFDYSGDIVFENISYTYSANSPFHFTALEQTNLVIKKNKITAIIGTTGSGKSTLIQLCNGLLKTDTGRTIVGNFPINASVKKIVPIKPLRKEIGLVFQFPEYQLFQETIEKDISFGPITMGESKEEAIKKVPDLLKLVDLPVDYASRSPFALSGGQKRRVAIAGIIAMNGNTLVLDEPTGGLDPQGEEDFIRLFTKLNKEDKKRIIIVTHNMDHVLKMADEVIVMKDGKPRKIGTPFEIFKDKNLLEEIQIEPPKIYQLAYKFKDKGIDVMNEEFRTIDELVKFIADKRKGK